LASVARTYNCCLARNYCIYYRVYRNAAYDGYSTKIVIMKTRVSAFTLVEILVALVIIGVMLSFVAPAVLGRPEQARKLKIENDFSSIKIALDLYKLDNSNFPPVNLGMDALLNNDGVGYLNKAPVDPWGTEYRLDYQDDSIYVISAGPDKKFGGLHAEDDHLSDAIQ
jgi:general secretion pathway protein G